VTDQISFKNVKQWLQEIDRYACEHVNKLLVGNKVDMKDKRVIDYNTAKTFASSLSGMTYIETSAKNDENVDLVFSTLAQEIKNRLANTITNGHKKDTVHPASSQTQLSNDCAC